ncbi:uncharacterized protein BP5553_02028 [Venustampulla echinocandica]|uniref:Uncharacterized protein n=1 Tax=Venustampulla echinocandica TaxID=2656787 RepID=A0A370U2P1_9HELO|nr:uncharacterized protein BP5553_02028 [Venustampulla echinocandica]RDL42049.1 hypothetical protein BP5553_02028 [Venustampulla echinocandica]
MAIPDAIQTLSAAFSFGILVQAASAALFLYFKGHGTKIFQDGRRLVLMLFLLFAALWAQVGFVNLMVGPTSPTACQTLLVFTTIFDQGARVVMEQFLLWTLSQGTKVTAQQLVLQGILGIRLVAGGILVGFTRPDFAPVCVARTSAMPVNITVLALDLIIIGVLIIRAFSSGMFHTMRNESQSIQGEQSKAFILSIAGVVVWTATSVPMTLGLSTVILIVRTVVPTNGLIILVGMVTIFSGVLLSPKEEEGITPEARSPFTAPTPPSRELFIGGIGDGSPVSGRNYTKNGMLFVVNPSATPRDSPTTRFQGNHQGDTKGFTKLGDEVRVRALGGDRFGEPESSNGHDRGSSGAFFSALLATPLQAGNQLAMPPNVKAAPERMRNIPMSAAAQQKRSLFNWSKAPAKTPIRNLVISKPVMENSEDDVVQTFTRMPTIDLATAAINERERREGVNARSRLVANRPAPEPPSLPPAQEGLRKSISLKRKVPPSHPAQPMPTIAGSNSSNLSVNGMNGNTTSVSLSPNREEVRRRSPRNTDNFEKWTDEKLVSKPSFSRKATTGLPMNPRSQRMATAGQTGLGKEQTVLFVNDIVYDNPAVVKTIIDAAPDMYASAKRPKTAGKVLDNPLTRTPHSSNSVIHRPRPIKRDSDMDRILFPSEPSPNHRRSKSATYMGVRKSLLASQPGSPTKLPPLPPPPTSAMKLRRLLPNDTKSMTFDEKMELLFPAPPGVPTIPSRRSSVPSLPPFPSMLLSNIAGTNNPVEDKHYSVASKRTTIGLFGPLDLNDQPTSPNRELKRSEQRQAYRFSANTYQNIADQVGETWIPGIPASEVDIRNSVQPPPESDSVMETRKSSFSVTTSSDASSHEDSVTYWGSVHSELSAIDLSKERQTARSTFIPCRNGSSDAVSIPPVPSLASHDEETVMTVMMDPGDIPLPIPPQPTGGRTSFFLDADQTSLEDKVYQPPNAVAWHHRIGDELPTFSERRSNSRARKMPPPTPLLLNSSGRQTTAMIHASEPSPISPPERAIQEIQAQLKRFEEPSRGSVGSIMRHLPHSTDLGSAQDDEDSRLQLLENLEKEMGEQETQWQHMQDNLDRDSISVVMTPQEAAPSEHDLHQESSQVPSRTPSLVLSRRARIRSSMTRSGGEDSTSTVSTLSSDNSRASIWQQRLAEAQVEYLEKAPPPLREKSLNFLSAPRHHQLGSPTPPDSVDSDSDYETELELDGFTMVTSQNSKSMPKQLASLWESSAPSPNAASGRLWNPPYEVSAVYMASREPPAKDIRPILRQTAGSLEITSSALWSKPRSSDQSRAVAGLWGSTAVRPRSRVTRRPLRKSKRITFLPDIIESPTPLPNKRDTLGIFQFPWGEQSDSAVYQPAFNPGLLGAPILNASLQARSRQLEPESNGYSSSFFDDYDEEHDDDDYIDPESDDDFDETTLWEIASLLESTSTPSENSLVPQPPKLIPISEIIEDYDDESDTEDSTGEDLANSRTPIRPLVLATRSQLWTASSDVVFSAAATGLPQPEETIWKSLVASTEGAIRSKPHTSEILPVIASCELWAISEPQRSPSPSNTLMWESRDAVTQSHNSSPKSEKALLWRSQPKQEDRNNSTGLFNFSNDKSVVRTTQASPAASEVVRPTRPTNGTLASLASRNLWSANHSLVEEIDWISEYSRRQKSSRVASSQAMWTPAKPVIELGVTVHELFSVSSSPPSQRTTALAPAAIGMARNPRTISAPLSGLESDELWNGFKPVEPEHHWISESSISPNSPSLCSNPSSGESSPASDASSVKSTSSKASSLWGSISSTASSAVPWWSPKSKKLAPSQPPKDSSKQPSNIPVRQLPTKSVQPSVKPTMASKIPAPVKPLEPLRESMVLVSRSNSAIKVPTLDSTPAKKFRRTVIAQQSVSPIHRPLRHQYTPTIAFRANWDEALAEAIIASTPKKALTRSRVTEADWTTALNSAIVKSQPLLVRQNASPKMWDEALNEAMAKSVTSSSITSNYDPSSRHPVFFTQKLISKSADIHPAALGYVTSTTSSQVYMWSPPINTMTIKAAALWSKGTVSKPAFNPNTPGFNLEPSRNAPITMSLDLPMLQSSSLWAPSQTVALQRNWLAAASKAKAKTWTPRVISPVTKGNNSHKMWSAPDSVVTIQCEHPDMFAHVEAEYAKKSAGLRAPALPNLISNQLFGLALDSQPESTHWLHTTCKLPEASNLPITSPITAIQGQTWAKPVSVAPVEQGVNSMWESRTSPINSSPALFSNPHTTPWDRKKGQPDGVKTIESTEMWRPSMEIPASPKNWLVTRGFSRVEFRY